MMHDNLPHPGVRIDRIDAEGGGGLIFVLGITGLLLYTIPALVPVAAACLLAGLALAPAIHRLSPREVSAGDPLLALMVMGVSVLAGASLGIIAGFCALGGIATAVGLARVHSHAHVPSIR